MCPLVLTLIRLACAILWKKSVFSELQSRFLDFQSTSFLLDYQLSHSVFMKIVPSYCFMMQKRKTINILSESQVIEKPWQRGHRQYWCVSVWEGTALQQGHKSCLWQSHCQHSYTTADKALCSLQNTHRIGAGLKWVKVLWTTAVKLQKQSGSLYKSPNVRNDSISGVMLWLSAPWFSDLLHFLLFSWGRNNSTQKPKKQSFVF